MEDDGGAIARSASASASGDRRVAAARWAGDVVIALACGLSPFITYSPADAWGAVAAIIASVGLLVRRRWPWVSFVLALPAFTVNVALFAMMVALYSVARRNRRIRITVASSLLLFGIQTLNLALVSSPWPFLANILTWYNSSLYSALYVLAPAALGVAVRIGIELRAKVQRILALQDERAQLLASQALERERAVLAREMHDVVSNQVSLIAVQAGALQVASGDPVARGVAGTIRSLSVTTLDELRAMIEVLRAAGGTDRGPASQPTLEDLPDLLSGSGIVVHSHVELDRPLPTAVQRAVFRLAQEGLTNARKHAPGAEVRLLIVTTGTRVVAELVAEPGRTPALDLPSAHHGLVGLRERAELLGGTLTRTLHEDGTHTLRMTLPTDS